MEIKLPQAKVSKQIEFNGQQSFNQSYINDLIDLKKTISVAPTFTPTKFIDQIQFYDDGTNFRLYLYVNNVWRYVALT